MWPGCAALVMRRDLPSLKMGYSRRSLRNRWRSVSGTGVRDVVTDQPTKPTILCIASYEKGQAFLREADRLGCRVVLLTLDNLLEGDWPRKALARLVTMPKDLTAEQIVNTVTNLARAEKLW